MEHMPTRVPSVPYLGREIREGLTPFLSQEETRLQKAQSSLGELAESLPDEELEDHLTIFQSLLDGWLDTYERQAFDGLTLREVLRER